MTIQEQKAAVFEAQQLWALVLPNVEPPDPYRFWTWVTTFPTTAITIGITRAAAKHRKMSFSVGMTAEETARYASSVIRNEFEAMEGLQ